MKLDSDSTQHCYEDAVTKPMVMSAVKAYEASCGMREATEF